MTRASVLIILIHFILNMDLNAQQLEWVFLPNGDAHGTCTSQSDYYTGTLCYGLEYTPSVSGTVTSYTMGFFVECINGNTNNTVASSCTMLDNTNVTDACGSNGIFLLQASAVNGSLGITVGQPVILHQVCMDYNLLDTISIEPDPFTDITLSIDSAGTGDPITEVITYIADEVDYSDFEIFQCSDTTSYFTSFGSDVGQFSFAVNGNNNIADATDIVNSIPPPQSFNIYDEDNGFYNYFGGMDDAILTMQVINTSDVNGNGIIDGEAGVTHKLFQTTNGLQGEVPMGIDTGSESSSGDLRGYSVRVDFADHIEILADQLTVNLIHANSSSEAFESARLEFLDAAGNPFATSNYDGYFGGTNDLSGNCNPTAPNNPWMVAGNGTVVFDDTNAVDLSSPCTPIAGTSGTADTLWINARTDANLDSAVVVQGFILTVLSEDVATPDQLDDGSNTSGEDDVVANRPTNTDTTNISQLAGFEVKGCAFKSTILAVDDIDLSLVERSNNKVQLEWITYVNDNIDVYQVLSSKNGIDFNLIGEIEVSNQKRKYNFLSESLSGGIQYFMIKGLNDSGQYYTSDIEYVHLKLNGDVTIYPNPANLELYIDLGQNSDKTRIRIYSSDGRLMRDEWHFPFNEKINLPIDRLLPGLYFIQVRDQFFQFVKK